MRRHRFICIHPTYSSNNYCYVLSFDFSAVARGCGVHHRLLVVEYNVLSAKLDVLVPVQIALAPFCEIKVGSETERLPHKRRSLVWLQRARSTCVDVAVFASILRGDDRSHVGSAQGREETEFSVEPGDVPRLGHHHLTTRHTMAHRTDAATAQRHQLTDGKQRLAHVLASELTKHRF